ncbi:MAG: carboxypeptidase regulatory-like domain-containing protein [Gammaproteobacteria bacterium]|nr:carboxypeptidase regulatory-like domain-containing protein [Gammaproteobacteria bacterium]
MKRIVRLLAGMLVICASSAAMAQSADGGMRIAVVSMETQRPLEGVTVTVTGRDGNVITGRTQANGTVELRNLATGLYAIAAEGPGLIAAKEPSVRVVARRVTPLNVAMRASPEVLAEVVVEARAQIADPNGAASNVLA